MAQEKTPVQVIPLNDTSYSWQIIGLSNPFNETYYVKASIFDRAFTNGQSTLPVGMISERDAPVTNPYNSSEMTSVDSMTAGKTYTVYGGVLTPSGQWWTTTPASASVTLPQVTEKSVDFKTVTWQTPQNPTNKPYGQNYLENVTAMNTWGRLGLDGQRHHLWGFYESQSTDPDMIIHETWNALQQNLNPLVRYTVKVTDLNKLLNQNVQPLKIGDSVNIVDRDLGISLQARILERSVDLNSLEKSTIVVGQVAETMSNTMASQPSNPPPNYDDFLKVGDPINTDWLEGKIEALKNQLIAGGGTVTITDDDGILIVDPNSSGNAMKLEGGIFAISNSLNPDGSYNWRTFGTGAGFTADLINAGTINGITINGVTINGSTIKGGTISSGTTITVATDLTIGKNLYFGTVAVGETQQIWFASGARISCSSAGLVVISAPTLNIGGTNVNPSGAWNFAGATVTGLPVTTAKFG